jgi:hypothetical protein
MGGFAGALGPAWFASSLFTHAGPFGALYGMTLRASDQLFGEVFDLQGYRERDFGEAAWHIFNPANVALDYGFGVAFAGLANYIKFGTPTPSEAQIAMAYPPKLPAADVKAKPSGEVSQVSADDVASVKRPSWRQSEIDAAKGFPDYEPQKSFLNGQEVPYGTEGSSRPELYRTGHSIEVKNYNIQTNSGRNNLINNVSRQINERVSNLPGGTEQTIIIDVRGQDVSNTLLREIRNKIFEKAGISVEIIFMR